MATIKITKFVCPHCGKDVSYRHLPQRGFQVYGCKTHQCRACGGEFRDPAIREIGLYAKESTYPKPIQFRLGWLIAYGIVPLGSVVFLLYKDEWVAARIWFLLPLFLALHLITDLLLYGKRKNVWQKEYDKSTALLSNPAYREWVEKTEPA